MTTCTACGFKPAEALNFCPKCGNDLRGLSPSNDTLSGAHVGKVIADRYRLREKLGEGGMGAVFKVEHVRMGKVMALKLMRRELSRDKAAVERFVAEARIVSRLSHIHTISVFDFGEAEDGSQYIAMEFCPGKDLAFHLRVDGRFGERRAARVVSQVLRSLGEAHDAGIVHRDVKPGNVMLLKSREGEDFAKVLDFGIAKLAEARLEDGKAITGVSEFVGTPSYMAPEQARGGKLGPGADLYAVGAMLFELVTGRIPFDAPTPMGIVTAHVTEAPPRPRDVAPDAGISQALEAVILRALEKDPARRFPSADAMREALEDAAGLRAASRLSPAAPTVEGDIASREDWDRFEQRLRREISGRGFVATGLVLALFAAGAAGIVYRKELSAALRSGAVSETEEEPNNTSGDANLIAAGQPVRGTMTGRFDNEGDRDTFELPLPPGAHVARVTLSPIPDINLLLYLFDAQGKPLQKIDRAPAGQAEVATRVLVKERLFVQVRQNPDGGAPKENSVDGYSLAVTLEPPAEGVEVEPNDELEQAAPLAAGATIRGVAGATGDRDLYRIDAAGEVSGVLVTGVPGADLVLAAFEDPALPRKPVDESPAAAGELWKAPRSSAGPLYVAVEVADGADHESSYELTVLGPEPAAELGAVAERLASEGRHLDAATLALRGATRFGKTPETPELLFRAGVAAIDGAAALSAKAKAALGTEPDPKAREAALRELPELEAWKRAGLPLRWVASRDALAYGGEVLQRLVAEHPQHPRAAEAAALLVTVQAAPCGPAAVADRAGAFLDRFPASPHRGKALLALGRAREDLARLGGAKAAAHRSASERAYRAVVADFPGSAEAGEAAERLDALAARRPAPALSFPCD